jgi:hypothetical protein
MFVRGAARWSYRVGVFVFAVACSSQRQQGAGPNPRGERAVCQSASDCASGICGKPFDDALQCLTPCRSDADCVGGEKCGLATDGTSICQMACAYGFQAPNGKPYPQSCYRGAVTPCEQTPCGCSCPTGQSCFVAPDGQSERCESPGNVGDPCNGDWGCVSGNCLSDANGKPTVCGSAIGSPCTATCGASIGDSCTGTDKSCPVCYVTSASTTSCSRLCTDSCPVGSLCSGGAVSSHCWPECDSAGMCPAGLQCFIDSADGGPPWICWPPNGHS